jgi:hypothetical protein
MIYLHEYLSLAVGLFPSGFPTTISYAEINVHMRATFHTHLIPIDIKKCPVNYFYPVTAGGDSTLKRTTEICSWERRREHAM